MSTLRPELPPLPPRMKSLPVDRRGYPVPYFVATVNGEPDHRIAAAEALDACMRLNLCWLCGQPLGRFKSFCIGPMCAITRTISEPPQHLECSLFAARACPFLTRPHAKRREAGLPDAAYPAGGNGIRRNPGAVCVWVTLKHQPFFSYHGNEGVLFDIGRPYAIHWFAEGRPATRAEVDESIASGLPLLRSEAEADGEEGLHHLEQRVAELHRMLDATLPRLEPAELDQTH
jgi:hypothetical protein